jgi:hypothetical protein
MNALYEQVSILDPLNSHEQNSAECGLCLRIVKEPPLFVYDEGFFELQVELVDRAGSPQPDLIIPLGVELLYESSRGKVADSSALVLFDDGPLQFAAAAATIRLRVRQLSAGVAFQLRVFPLLEASLQSDLFFQPEVTSNRFFVVRYQLVLTEQPRAEWHNQAAGGRRNFLQLSGHLEDYTGSIVTDRKVQLRATLMYEDFSLVQNQNILQLLPHCSPLAIQPDGTFTMQFKITQVSRTHLNKSFRVNVAPLLREENDISSITTSCVTVLSKVAKRKLEDGSTDEKEETRSRSPSASRRSPRPSRDGSGSGSFPAFKVEPPSPAPMRIRSPVPSSSSSSSRGDSGNSQVELLPLPQAKSPMRTEAQPRLSPTSTAAAARLFLMHSSPSSSSSSSSSKCGCRGCSSRSRRRSRSENNSRRWSRRKSS